MLIDKYGCVIMEHSSWEGNRGDSCAETSRYAHLMMLLGNYDFYDTLDLSHFRTEFGYLRHPELENFVDNKGVSWGVKDFSSDQALPLYLAYVRACYFQSSEEMRKRLTYKTGNGDLVSPGLFAELHDSQLLRTTLLLGQQLLFKLPKRWNDEKQGFQATEESVCDYLNYIHVAVYAPAWVRKLGPDKEKLFDAVYKYYQTELDLEFKDSILNGRQEDIVAHAICIMYGKVLEKYWT